MGIWDCSGKSYKSLIIFPSEIRDVPIFHCHLFTSCPQTNAHHCHGPNGSKWAFILRNKKQSGYIIHIYISYQGYNLFQVPSLMPVNSLTRKTKHVHMNASVISSLRQMEKVSTFFRWARWGGNQLPINSYPLVMTNIAIENGH